MASPSSSSRFRHAQAQQLFAGMPHHLQGKRLDSTPVMALNNNLGLPRPCSPLCPLARRHGRRERPSRSRPTTLGPCRTLSCRKHFTRFFSLPPAPLCRKRYPCCLWARKLFPFKRIFFSSRNHSVHQALSSSAEMLFARA